MTRKETLKVFKNRKLQEKMTDKEYRDYISCLRSYSNVDWDADYE